LRRHQPRGALLAGRGSVAYFLTAHQAAARSGEEDRNREGGAMRLLPIFALSAGQPSVLTATPSLFRLRGPAVRRTSGSVVRSRANIDGRARPFLIRSREGDSFGNRDRQAG
jgi:hypothetical protein